MIKTYEIGLGPKNSEHTRIQFDADQMIHAAWVFSEPIQDWVSVENQSQINHLADQDSVSKAMAEHLYQLNNDSELGA